VTALLPAVAAAPFPWPSTIESFSRFHSQALTRSGSAAAHASLDE
jgi:hypothetical protein